MGVNGLWDYLKKNHAGVFEDADTRPAQKWGIDVALFMHKKALDPAAGPPTAKFVEDVEEFRRLNIEPIYIFEGARDQAKRHEHERRRKAMDRTLEIADQRRQFLEQVQQAERGRDEPLSERDLRQMADAAGDAAPPDLVRALGPQTTQLTKIKGLRKIKIEVDPESVVAGMQARQERQATIVESDGRAVPDSFYWELMLALDERGVGYMVAPGDAEHLGAALTQRGELDAFVTDDGDALVFGSVRMVRNLFCEGRYGMTELRTATVLAAIGVTREQFVDACIMSGCDFTGTKRGIPLIGPKKAFEIVKKHGSLAGYLGSPAWTAKQAALARNPKYADFRIEELEHDAARAKFLDTSVVPAYRSIVLDPTASPLAGYTRSRAHTIKEKDSSEVCSKSSKSSSSFMGGERPTKRAKFDTPLAPPRF